MIFVTGRDASEDVVAMLEAGADDYITKPVNLNELLARVVALGRRVQPSSARSDHLEVAPFLVDYASHQVMRSGKVIHLTPKEFQLADMLLRNIGRMLLRRDLLMDIWGYGPEINSRTIDIHVSASERSVILSRATAGN